MRRDSMGFFMDWLVRLALRPHMFWGFSEQVRPHLVSYLVRGRSPRPSGGASIKQRYIHRPINRVATLFIGLWLHRLTVRQRIWIAAQRPCIFFEWESSFCGHLYSLLRPWHCWHWVHVVRLSRKRVCVKITSVACFCRLIGVPIMLSCSACLQRCLRSGVGVANRQFSSYLRQKVRLPSLQHVARCFVLSSNDANLFQALS